MAFQPRRNPGQHDLDPEDVVDPRRFSETLAANTSKVAMIFRRYDELALRNLLRLNTKLEIMDRGGSDDHLGVTIKDYHEALHLYSQILKLENPAPRTVLNLKEKIPGMRSVAGDDMTVREFNSLPLSSETAIYRLESTYIEGENYPDLVSLYTPAEDDMLSRGLYQLFWFLFIDRDVSIRKSDQVEGQLYVNEGRFQGFVTFVGMMLAVGYLVAAMWVLWILGDDMVVKLATVTGFIVAFALWVGSLTSAGRREVISATSAYAAVLVVYVGSTSYQDNTPATAMPTSGP